MIISNTFRQLLGAPVARGSDGRQPLANVRYGNRNPQASQARLNTGGPLKLGAPWRWQLVPPPPPPQLSQGRHQPAAPRNNSLNQPIKPSLMNPQAPKIPKPTQEVRFGDVSRPPVTSSAPLPYTKETEPEVELRQKMATWADKEKASDKNLQVGNQARLLADQISGILDETSPKPSDTTERTAWLGPPSSRYTQRFYDERQRLRQKVHDQRTHITDLYRSYGFPPAVTTRTHPELMADQYRVPPQVPPIPAAFRHQYPIPERDRFFQTKPQHFPEATVTYDDNFMTVKVDDGRDDPKTFNIPKEKAGAREVIGFELSTTDEVHLRTTELNFVHRPEIGARRANQKKKEALEKEFVLRERAEGIPQVMKTESAFVYPLYYSTTKALPKSVIREFRRTLSFDRLTPKVQRVIRLIININNGDSPNKQAEIQEQKNNLIQVLYEQGEKGLNTDVLKVDTRNGQVIIVEHFEQKVPFSSLKPDSQRFLKEIVTEAHKNSRDMDKINGLKESLWNSLDPSITSFFPYESFKIDTTGEGMVALKVPVEKAPPCIFEVKGYGVTFVNEYLPYSLKDYIKMLHTAKDLGPDKGGISETEFKTIVQKVKIDLIAGLDALHQRGLSLGNINVDTLRVSEHGQVKFAVFDGSMCNNHYNSYKHYDSVVKDRPEDVFALGVVFDDLEQGKLRSEFTKEDIESLKKEAPESPTYSFSGNKSPLEVLNSMRSLHLGFVENPQPYHETVLKEFHRHHEYGFRAYKPTLLQLINQIKQRGLVDQGLVDQYPLLFKKVQKAAEGTPEKQVVSNNEALLIGGSTDSGGSGSTTRTTKDALSGVDQKLEPQAAMSESSFLAVSSSSTDSDNCDTEYTQLVKDGLYRDPKSGNLLLRT